MELKLFVCKHCGNVVWKVVDKGVPVMCCGQKMEELIPGTTDAAQEKHVPAIKRDGDKVTITVGSVVHPARLKRLDRFQAGQCAKYHLIKNTVFGRRKLLWN